MWREIVEQAKLQTVTEVKEEILIEAWIKLSSTRKKLAMIKVKSFASDRDDICQCLILITSFPLFLHSHRSSLPNSNVNHLKIYKNNSFPKGKKNPFV